MRRPTIHPTHIAIAATVVGVAVCAVIVVKGQATVDSRNKKADVAVARFERNLASASSPEQARLVASVDKVEKEAALTAPELAVWRKAMRDAGADSTGVNKILDDWPEIRDAAG